jgi:pimeloyl-ACP methyl ester carboxylesterase
MSTDDPRLKGRGKHGRPLLAVFLALSLAFNVTSLAVLGNVLMPGAYAQGAVTETVRRRDLVIDLGDGLKTDAQLTLPVMGDGPFPGVLLIHGSGNTDMDEYLPPIATGTDEPTRLFLQIAEYLSNRGFAVLRYNKRGVGLDGAILDMDAWGKMTIQDLVQDAEKALEVLRQQPEVDISKISIIGHSEGTMIAPRIAIKDPTIANIVLMGAGAQNLREIVHFQIVDRPVKCAEDTFDTDHDGLLSIQEVEATLDYRGVNTCPLPPLALIQNITGEWGWQPGFDTNMDGYFDIENELKLLQTAMFDLYTSSDPDSPYYWVWLQSHFALNDTALDIIGDVSSSILILQGEGDTQTTVEQAFLLGQRLIEVEHVDHTLITYPGLGHTFYPVDGWIQPLGPMQDKVLADLYAWLESPARTVRSLEAQIQADAMQLEAARNETRSVHTKLTNDLNASNDLINDLQASLSTYEALTYIALTIAAIAIIGTILTRAGLSLN